MSGVQIHTEDPINPAKASGTTPQTAHSSNVVVPSQPGNTTTPPPYAYPPAQPGPTAPTPTSTIPQSSSNGPPAPQPGEAPVPCPPTTRRGVPPPPKAGEKTLSPEHYAPVQTTADQPQPYPYQMSQSPVDSPLRAIPPGSTTSTSMEPSSNHSSEPSDTPSSTDMPARASLEHPPGYVQNPFASDMTPDQRFAAQQQEENRSDTLPSLGYVDSSRGQRAGLEEDQTVLGTAIKWAKERGQEASKFGEKVWDKIGAEE